MTHVSEELRRQLAILARDPRRRNADWSTSKPTKWNPSAVRNPHSTLGLCFSDPEAWEFVASKLEEGHPIDVIPLDRVPGKNALVMKINLEEGRSSLYVKLQSLSGSVFGWSFHYSDYD